jgi:hypothetical protein
MGTTATPLAHSRRTTSSAPPSTTTLCLSKQHVFTIAPVGSSSRRANTTSVPYRQLTIRIERASKVHSGITFPQAVDSSANTQITVASPTVAMGSLGTYFLDVVYSFTNCMVCFPSSPQLKINSRSFKILRLLGEVSLDAFQQTALH